MKKGKLLVISGVSAGAGKDTLINMFLQKHPDWHWPPSTTTRQPRTGEEHGKHMNFVSHDEFSDWQKRGKFLETDYHADNWYGTLAGPVQDFLRAGENVILRIDVNGSLQIKQKIPEATLIFIDVESEQELESRIRSRGTESEAEIKARLKLAKKEKQLKDQFDFVVLNARGEHRTALAQIEKAVGL